MKIKRLIDYNLCLGCGLCQSIYPSKCEILLDKDGFYKPVFRENLTYREDKHISELCPAIQIRGNKHSGSWGDILYLCEGWSKERDIRHKAASGGVTTSLAIYLIENKIVDGILQVGVIKNNYLLNELKQSSSRDDIIQNAQSRYAPAALFKNILEILESNNKTYAFIGKPCDIAAIKNITTKYPEYQHKIKYCISIFCAGMPSYNATIKAWRQSDYNDAPVKLKYRGDGWPGLFKAEWKDGRSFTLNYNESWGKILGRELGLRCKMCPDGIGMLADISIGDSWSTKDGFPDFSEQEGRCFVIARTEKGKDLIKMASSDNYIEEQPLALDSIAKSQPYQAQRRKLTLWRLIPLQIKTRFLLRFKNLNIIRLGFKADLISAFKTLIGSTRRVF